jgi:hypothetical protein
VVNDSALIPHIDTTAIALLALTEEPTQPATSEALTWLRDASVECSSAYSLAWSALAWSAIQDPSREACIRNLSAILSSEGFVANVETLSLAAIAFHAAEENGNPFQVVR